MIRRWQLILLSLLLVVHFFLLSILDHEREEPTNIKPCFEHSGTNSSGDVVLNMEMFRRISDEGARQFEQFPSDALVLCPMKGIPEEVQEGVQQIVTRLARLRRICRTRPSELRLPPTNPKGVYYIKKLNAAYCISPKTGTSTWKWHFFQWSDHDGSKFTETSLHTQWYTVFPTLLDTPWGQKTLKNLRPLTMFVVRHPYARLVSAYRDKILHKSAYFRGIKKRMYWSSHGKTLQQMLIEQTTWDEKRSIWSGVSEDVEISFPEFIRFIIVSYLKCDGALSCMGYHHDHWWPLYLTCPPCDLDYDIIAKTETHSSDYALVKHLLATGNLITLKTSAEENKNHSETTYHQTKEEDTTAMGDKTNTNTINTNTTGTNTTSTTTTSTTTTSTTTKQKRSTSCIESHIQRNQSPGSNLITQQLNRSAVGSKKDIVLNSSIDKSKVKENIMCYMKQLTREERKYLDQLFYYDFKLFGYTRTEYN